MTAQHLHLVRHGEVHNPDHVVYAALDGFGLSELGRRQAGIAAEYLADRPVSAIVSSPLQRARETAEPLCATHSLPLVVDDDLTEWKLSALWEGLKWDSLPTERPGHLEAYLGHPDDLPFSPESLAQLAQRMAAGAQRNVPTEGDLVVISHQDPVQAARRYLTGRGFTDFHDDKPAHASVVTLEIAAELPWTERSHWWPEQGDTFPPT